RRRLFASCLRQCMGGLRIKWPSAAIQILYPPFRGSFLTSAPLVRGFSSCGLPGPDGFPCSAVRFTAGAPRNLQQPQLRQQQIILDHDATLGQLKKLPAGRSELAPAPAGPSLSSPPPAAQPGEFGFFIFLKKQGAQRSQPPCTPFPF